VRDPAERGTRDRILAVAEASLGAHGYHGTRLHEIASRVGIQKASLFHYFASKEQLYRAVVEQGMGETEQLIRHALESAGSLFDKLRTLLEAYVDLVALHPERTKILLRQTLGDAPESYQPADSDSERLLKLVSTFIREGQRKRVFAPIDPQALVLGIVGMVAFFFTSAPVLAPHWVANTTSAAAIAQIKRHVIEVVERALTPERA